MKIFSRLFLLFVLLNRGPLNIFNNKMDLKGLGFYFAVSFGINSVRHAIYGHFHLVWLAVQPCVHLALLGQKSEETNVRNRGK